MKSRPLTIREKNLGVIVFVGCLMIVMWGVSSRLTRKVERAKEDMIGVKERWNMTEKLLQAPPEQSTPNQPALPVNPLENSSSLLLLRDFIFPEVSEKVKILNSEKTKGGEYRVEVEGEFQELMKFMSFLERKEGKFRLKTANFRRGENRTEGPGANPANDQQGNISLSRLEPNRKVVAVFSLAMKG